MLLWLGIFKEKKEVATPDCAGEHCDLVVVHEKRCQQESLKQWEREERERKASSSYFFSRACAQRG